jgi:hypothetical protein
MRFYLAGKGLALPHPTHTEFFLPRHSEAHSSESNLF